MSFQRLLATALIVVATVPTIALGLIAYQPVQASLEADAEARTSHAVATARSLLASSASDIDDLAQSYATWPTLHDLLASSAVDSIRNDVLGFLVSQGRVDAAAIVDGATVIEVGLDGIDAADRSALFGQQPVAQPVFRSVGGGVYLEAWRDIGTPGEPAAARLILLRRLDAAFAAEVHLLTGFDVTLLDAAGRSTLATDGALAARLGPGALGPAETENRGGLAIGRVSLLDPAGSAGTTAAAGTLVLVAETAALQVTSQDLPRLLLFGIALTTLVALLVAIGLAQLLGRRLRRIHASLAAIADGRVSPTMHGDSGADALGRVNLGLNRLVETLDRREQILRRCLAMLGSLSADRALEEVVATVSREAVLIFGFDACRIVGADGTTLGSAVRPGSEPGAEASSRPVVAALGTNGPSEGSIVGDVDAASGWTDGDQAQFDVLGLLVGALLRDARLYGRASDRANRLDRVNRVQREFLRAVSHSFRTPLTTIDLAVEDLIDGSDGNAFLHERAVLVRAEERRLARQVAQVLTLSRLDAGMFHAEPEPVAAAALIEHVWSEVGGGRPIEILDRSEGMVAVVDRAAIEQIVAVLLDNAVRYASEGRIRVVLSRADGPGRRPGGRSANRPESERLRIVVEDEGPGVRVAEREQIFRRFVRGSASAGTDGVGLGLGIARALAASMDGDLRVVSGELSGAAFALTVPGQVGVPEAAEAGGAVDMEWTGAHPAGS